MNKYIELLDILQLIIDSAEASSILLKHVEDSVYNAELTMTEFQIPLTSDRKLILKFSSTFRLPDYKCLYITLEIPKINKSGLFGIVKYETASIISCHVAGHLKDEECGAKIHKMYYSIVEKKRQEQIRFNEEQIKKVLEAIK